MSAYVQTASDNFNRANSTDLGASWDATYTSFNKLQIVSNQVQRDALGGNGLGAESYNAVTLPNNQYSQLTFVTYTATLSGGGPCVRMSAPATATWVTVDTSGADLYRISKVVSGAFTVLGTATKAAASGDVVRLEAEATNFRLTVNGKLILLTADSAVTSGRAGQMLYVTTTLTNTIVDDWSCGTIASTSFSGWTRLRPAPFKPGVAR